MTASAGAAGLIKQATHVHQEEKKNEGKLNERFGKKKENYIVNYIKNDTTPRGLAINPTITPEPLEKLTKKKKKIKKKKQH